MTDFGLQRTLQDAHRRAARALGVLSLALERRRLSARSLRDVATALRGSAEELDAAAARHFPPPRPEGNLGVAEKSKQNQGVTK